MLNLSKTKLKNRLRVIVVEMPDYHSVCTGLYIKAGSRYEKKAQSGISHFLEHLVFKGTERYENTLAISGAIEGIGGQLNASTNQDSTFFYNQVPAKHYQKGLEIVRELVFKPKLREVDIEKEKPVIEEEIKMIKDLPQEHVVRLSYQQMGESGPLSRMPLGTRKTVLALERRDFKRYLRRFYRTANMVLVVAGAVRRDRLMKEIEGQFKIEATKRLKVEEGFSPTQTEPRFKLHHQKTNQAHLCLGTYGYGYDDPRRFAWALLNTILGVGMSSRLFEEIREKRGLCYAVGSVVDSFKEIGIQTIYAGLKKTKIELALKAILGELSRLKEKKITEKELQKAKEFEKGRLDLSLDDVFGVNQFFGEQELFYREKLAPSEYKEKLDQVKREDIKQVAQEIYQNNRLNLAVIGPYKKEDRFKKIFKI